MSIEEFVESNEFQAYIKNNPVKPLYIKAFDDTEADNQEETEKLIKIAEMLKNAVK